MRAGYALAVEKDDLNQSIRLGMDWGILILFHLAVVGNDTVLEVNGEVQMGLNMVAGHMGCVLVADVHRRDWVLAQYSDWDTANNRHRNSCPDASEYD